MGEHKRDHNIKKNHNNSKQQHPIEDTSIAETQLPPSVILSESSYHEEEEEDNSSLVFSDDSASLSDAYFLPHPESDLARPPRYRESDHLQPPNGQYSYYSYGATSPPTLWPSIQEDSEYASQDLPTAAKTSSSQQQQRNHRKIQKHQRMKQREQAARERAVVLIRGQPQDTKSWKDAIFGVLFLVQLVVVIFCAIRFGFGVILFRQDFGWRQHTDGMKHRTTNVKRTTEALVNASMHVVRNISQAIDETDRTSTYSPIISAQPKSQVIVSSGFTIDYKNVIALSSIAGIYSCVLTYISFGFMLILSRSLIQVMLVFSILVSLAWGVIGLTLDPYGVISLMGFAALLLTLGYTMYNWNRIPFAATNLYTALSAMRCTADITLLGLMGLLVSFGWCMIWTMAFVGIVNSFNNMECDEKNKCHPHVATVDLPIYLVLLLSFYWTNMVIKNVIKVTVASAIGTWWARPGDIAPFCSAAVGRPLWRSLTTSFGSICLGSLLVQPSTIVLDWGRWCVCCENCQNDKRGTYHETSKTGLVHDNSQVDSAADTIGLFRRIFHLCCGIGTYLRACNEWAYSYIGMYGYSFHEAGDRAVQLFDTRGWTEVVKDHLIDNVLLMASFVIGGSAGVFAVVVEETDGYEFTSFHKPIISAFVIGSVLGYVLSNVVLLGVVGSAVHTILVCFAADPFQFDKNHPRLSREMRESWTQQVWEPPV